MMILMINNNRVCRVTVPHTRQIRKMFFSVFLTLLAVGILSSEVRSIERKYLKTLSGRATGILPWKVSELSGLAHCRATPKKLWAVNDRGDDSNLYVLSFKAKLLKTYKLRFDKNKDWEDLSCGRCVNSDKECLYIADIGGNDKNRKKIRAYMINLPIKEESSSEGPTVVPLKIKMKYPDRGHNAEAMLVHPREKVLLIITKEKQDPKIQEDPSLYSLDLTKVTSFDERYILTYRGKVPLSRYLTEKDPPGSHWVSGAEFHPDGNWFVVISYIHLYRIKWPLHPDPRHWINLPVWIGVDRTQIESIAIHPNGRQMWLGSEVNRWREPLILMEIPFH